MRAAKIISIIGHPIFHPTWMMLILILSGITRFMPQSNAVFLGITVLMTCLIPGLVIMMVKRWGLIKSLEMEEREDRLGPLFIMLLFLYAAYRYFNKIPMLAIFNFYLTAVIVVTVLAFVISFFWKISLHTLGWGCFTAFLFIMTTVSLRSYLLYFIACIVISGVVASARLKLKSHNNAQIYAGFAVGFAAVIVSCYFLIV
jgi:hypothetical protein